jgi:MFS family permease
MLVVESVPEETRGRAFAAMGVLLMLGLAAGYGVAGPLLVWIGPRATIAWTSLALLLLGLMWIGPVRRPRSTLVAPLPTFDRNDIRTVGPAGG